MSKILVIRFSSLGDCVQSLSIFAKLREKFPESEVHWLTREDMADLATTHSSISRVISFPRKGTTFDLIRLGLRLRANHYSHLYDAHNSLRSRIVSAVVSFGRLWPWNVIGGSNFFFVRKPRNSFKRFLLFQLRINLFRQPFSGQRDLLDPLAPWGISSHLPPTPQFFVPPRVASGLLLQWPKLPGSIALAPSAAHLLKRWPLSNWRALVDRFPHIHFYVLGGPEDGFLNAMTSANNVTLLAGQLSPIQSATVVTLSRGLITNDTWLMHIAEQTDTPAIAFMGPAPFGFPSRPSTKILERLLPCRPCSKHGQGPCRNRTFQACLTQISVHEVALELERLLK